MFKKPFFSIIIPTYHRNDLLAKCLDCLAPGVQILSSEQYEVIVTDDGSETTAEAMLQDQYPWAKWVSGPRKGPAANRNNGANYAQGKWLVFTDDDCLPSPNWLSAFASAITPQIQVYEGKTTCDSGLRSPLEHAPINLTGGYLWSCNLMIKKSAFHALQGFDESFPYPHMEDVDLRERLYLSKLNTVFVQKAVVDHPPRVLPWGNHLAASQESLVFYHVKHGKERITNNRLLGIILKTRLKSILSFPISLESLKAVLSLITELVYVSSKLSDWNKKYSS